MTQNRNKIVGWCLRRGKNRGNLTKTFRSKAENQETQPTCDAKYGNRTRVTLMGGECSHHCAIPVSFHNLSLFCLTYYRFDNLENDKVVNAFISF